MFLELSAVGSDLDAHLAEQDVAIDQGGGGYSGLGFRYESAYRTVDSRTCDIHRATAGKKRALLGEPKPWRQKGRLCQAVDIGVEHLMRI